MTNSELLENENKQDIYSCGLWADGAPVMKSKKRWVVGDDSYLHRKHQPINPEIDECIDGWFEYEAETYTDVVLHFQQLASMHLERVMEYCDYDKDKLIEVIHTMQAEERALLNHKHAWENRYEELCGLANDYGFSLSCQVFNKIRKIYKQNKNYMTESLYAYEQTMKMLILTATYNLGDKQ